MHEHRKASSKNVCELVAVTTSGAKYLTRMKCSGSVEDSVRVDRAPFQPSIMDLTVRTKEFN